VTAIAVLRIGTRASRLALAQAAIAAEALEAFGATAIVPVRTVGDDISARHPRGRWVDSDGQFTRDLEQALLDDQVDVVVHSFKDMPTAPTPGLVIGAVLPRADARDCLVTAAGTGLDGLPFGARIGTSSPRRAAQLSAARNDLIAMPIRGNVETRLRRLESGEYDGLLLAAAGLDRLGIPVPDSARLPFALMLPAPAQGALALQIRADDRRLRDILAQLDDVPTRAATEAERSLLRRVGGGCLAPLGALGIVEDDMLHLRAAYESRDGTYARAEARGPVGDAERIVDTVADGIARAVAAT
jgi:hydroxymethylbilane synthase